MAFWPVFFFNRGRQFSRKSTQSPSKTPSRRHQPDELLATSDMTPISWHLGNFELKWNMITFTKKRSMLGGGFKEFVFSPLLREDSHFDQYVSNGLKPPTSMQLKSRWLISVPFPPAKNAHLNAMSFLSEDLQTCPLTKNLTAFSLKEWVGIRTCYPLKRRDAEVAGTLGAAPIWATKNGPLVGWMI